mmetsp:Transcript_617/g.1913  ORF Transcript_617/g.1913 Transcript_617/m.1913 type:complete len:268 (-) Transcript_617:201-1004(-)
MMRLKALPSRSSLTLSVTAKSRKANSAKPASRYTHADMHAAPTMRAMRTAGLMSVSSQSVRARYNSSVRRSSSSKASTSLSAGSAASSSAFLSATSVIKYMADMSAISWTSAATAKVTDCTLGQMPPSLARSIIEPAMDVGATKKRMGNDPICICALDRRKMPVTTDVGQSGPPRRIATFDTRMPGCDRIRLTARIDTLFTFTNLRTRTLPARFSPIPACCMKMAACLMAQQTRAATRVAVQNPSSYVGAVPNSRIPLAPRITPPAR